jgi:SM-20-related protein
MFEYIDIENKILPNPYFDYPYLIIKNFLSDELCKDIINDIKKDDDFIKAQIITNEEHIIDSQLDEKYRKTNIYELNDEVKSIYFNRFNEITPIIEDFYKLVITSSTDIQVLEYKNGYYYKKHADDSSELIDKNKNTIGFKTVAAQRKISTVLFATNYDDEVNDNYSFNGGELVFNYLFDSKNEVVKIRPQMGDLLIFPSNPIFSHEILKVKDGYRLTLVQWHDAIIN